VKIKKIDKNFYSIFDTDTGFYLRSGEFVNGKETVFVFTLLAMR